MTDLTQTLESVLKELNIEYEDTGSHLCWNLMFYTEEPNDMDDDRDFEIHEFVSHKNYPHVFDITDDGFYTVFEFVQLLSSPYFDYGITLKAKEILSRVRAKDKISYVTVDKIFGAYSDYADKIEFLFDTYIGEERHQNEIRRIVTDQKDHFIIAPTASGKTTAILKAAEYCPKLIILFPNTVNPKQVVENNKDKDVFAVHEEISHASVQMALTTNSIIASTYDGFTKIINGIIKKKLHPEEFTLIIDEYHNFVTQINIRQNIVRLIERYKFMFRKTIYLTATPEGVLTPDFTGEIDIFTINAPKSVVKCNYEILEYSKDGKELLIKHIVDHQWKGKVVIFVNSFSLQQYFYSALTESGYDGETIAILNKYQKKSSEYNHIVEKENLSERTKFLITTSVISDGINIKTPDPEDRISAVYFFKVIDLTIIRQFFARFRDGVDNCFDFIVKINPDNANRYPSFDDLYKRTMSVAQNVLTSLQEAQTTLHDQYRMAFIRMWRNTEDSLTEKNDENEAAFDNKKKKYSLRSNVIYYDSLFSQTFQLDIHKLKHHVLNGLYLSIYRNSLDRRFFLKNSLDVNITVSDAGDYRSLVSKDKRKNEKVERREVFEEEAELFRSFLDANFAELLNWHSDKLTKIAAEKHKIEAPIAGSKNPSHGITSLAGYGFFVEQTLRAVNHHLPRKVCVELFDKPTKTIVRTAMRIKLFKYRLMMNQCPNILKFYYALREKRDQNYATQPELEFVINYLQNNFTKPLQTETLLKYLHHELNSRGLIGSIRTSRKLGEIIEDLVISKRHHDPEKGNYRKLERFREADELVLSMDKTKDWFFKALVQDLIFEIKYIQQTNYKVNSPSEFKNALIALKRLISRKTTKRNRKKAKPKIKESIASKAKKKVHTRKKKAHTAKKRFYKRKPKKEGKKPK